MRVVSAVSVCGIQVCDLTDIFLFDSTPVNTVEAFYLQRAAAVSVV